MALSSRNYNLARRTTIIDVFTMIKKISIKGGKRTFVRGDGGGGGNDWLEGNSEPSFIVCRGSWLIAPIVLFPNTHTQKGFCHRNREEMKNSRHGALYTAHQ